MSELRPEVIGPDRIKETPFTEIVNKVDAALGGRPATVAYTPDTVGSISLDDLAAGLRPLHPAGQNPVDPDALPKGGKP